MCCCVARSSFTLRPGTTSVAREVPLQASEEARRAQADAHSALLAEAAELSSRLATAEAAALLARQRAADNESFSCIRESLSNQVSSPNIGHHIYDLKYNHNSSIRMPLHSIQA